MKTRRDSRRPDKTESCVFQRLNETGYSGLPAGGVRLTGGVDSLLDEDKRLELASLIEKGDVPLFLSTDCEACKYLPLALIDFSFLISETGEKNLRCDPNSWAEACEVISLYAAIAGIKRACEQKQLLEQCQRLLSMTPPGFSVS